MKHTKGTVEFYLNHLKSPSKKLEFLYSVKKQLEKNSTNALKEDLTPKEKVLLNWVKSEITYIEANRKKFDREYQGNNEDAINLTESQKEKLESLTEKSVKERLSSSDIHDQTVNIIGNSNIKKETKKRDKPGRKLDNEAAPQDLIESKVSKLIEKGGRYINEEGKPKPTTIRNEIIKDPQISLGERALFNRVKRAIKEMQ